MAAKTTWSRERAQDLAGQISLCLTAAPDIGTLHICGDTRRDPYCTEVKHLCIVGELDPEADLELARDQVRQAAREKFGVKNVKRFKFYEYVTLEDGNVSWVVSEAENLGAALAHATGPVDFVKMTEMFAEAHGFKFGASGLKSLETEEKVPVADETSLFETMGAQYIEVTDRGSARIILPLGDPGPKQFQ